MAERGRPLFSIGAVARMLDVSAATIRTWETRYKLVIPQRSGGGQRLYSRDQVDQLRFVRSQIAEGRRPAEAHRLLSERLARGEELGVERLRVLLAESRLGIVESLRAFLGGDRFEVVLTTDPQTAVEAYECLAPALVVIDTSDDEFGLLSEALRRSGTKIVPLEHLEGSIALLEGAQLLET